MKVLIVDSHLGTRQAISKLVTDEFTDAEVSMAADGYQALNMIVGGKFDIIITNNHLRGYNGANLLQAINRGKRSPLTLLHSSHARGYMVTGNNGREEIDLSEFVETYFKEFAAFRLKDRDFTYIPEFLAKFSTQHSSLRKDAMKTTGGRSHFVS